MKNFINTKMIGWLLVIGLAFGTWSATAAPKSKSTKLRGTLTIDFNVRDLNPTIPSGFTFTVAKDKKYSLYDPSGTAAFGSEFPVPNSIRGGTFTLNAECTNAIATDNNAGRSHLRVRQKGKRGTRYRASVTSGAAKCLIANGATRVDSPFDDPFLGNDDLSFFLAGQRAIWLTQILASAEALGEGVNTLRTFFEVPVEQTVVEPKYRTSELSIYLNRGGSAQGVISNSIELKFKTPKHETGVKRPHHP